jgi:phosphoserine phosphatase
LRGTLVRTAKELGFDIAVQPAALRWRPKRLVLLDVTSTLVGPDATDPVAQLAERAGRGAHHAEIAMRESAGELDCAGALRARAALLAGLPAHELARVGQVVPVRDDARPAVAMLRALGFLVGAVCSDPGFAVERLRDELRLDFVAGNRFEVSDGVLTGRLLEPLADRAGKAAALVRFAEQHRVPLSQTVAVGSGANDLDLLQTAGLAVACTGAVSLLDALGCALGAGEDVREAAQAKG